MFCVTHCTVSIIDPLLEVFINTPLPAPGGMLQYAPSPSHLILLCWSFVIEDVPVIASFAHLKGQVTCKEEQAFIHQQDSVYQNTKLNSSFGTRSAIYIGCAKDHTNRSDWLCCLRAVLAGAVRHCYFRCPACVGLSWFGPLRRGVWAALPQLLCLRGLTANLTHLHNLRLPHALFVCSPGLWPFPAACVRLACCCCNCSIAVVLPRRMTLTPHTHSKFLTVTKTLGSHIDPRSLAVTKVTKMF